MFTAGNGLPDSINLLDRAAILAFVKQYPDQKPLHPKQQQCIAHFNAILPAFEKCPRLIQIYSHPYAVQTLCDAMFSTHPDRCLLNSMNMPALINQLWHHMLNKFHQQNNCTLEQLQQYHSDERLFLGHFAFTLLRHHQAQAALTDAMPFMSKRTGHCQEKLKKQILSLGLLTQVAETGEYAFYDESFQYYFAAQFMVSCMMPEASQQDVIEATMIDSVQKFIVDRCEDEQLDELWYHVYAAFPLHTGAHERLLFLQKSIQSRAECAVVISEALKLHAHSLPAAFKFRCELTGENQFAVIGAAKQPVNANIVFELFNDIFTHFEQKGICKFISTPGTHELIFTSKSALEIRNIVAAFKQIMGARLITTEAGATLFAGRLPTSKPVAQQIEAASKQELATSHPHK